jgi:hypothetical protein
VSRHQGDGPVVRCVFNSSHCRMGSDGIGQHPVLCAGASRLCVSHVEIQYWVCGSPAICCWRKPVVYRFMDHN